MYPKKSYADQVFVLILLALGLTEVCAIKKGYNKKRGNNAVPAMPKVSSNNRQEMQDKYSELLNPQSMRGQRERINQMGRMNIELDAEPYAPDDAYFSGTFPYYSSVNNLPFVDFAESSNCFQPTPSNYIYTVSTDPTPHTVNLTWCYGHQARHLPPPCVDEDDLVYNNETGAFSADQTIYNCMANIDDVNSLPTFYNGMYHGCMLINTQMTLLNLVHIDEVSGTAELQVIIDYIWIDERYTMPMFWSAMHNSASFFDMTTMLQNDSTNVWLPEVVFPDAQNVQVMTSTLSLSPAAFDYGMNGYGSTMFTYEVTYDLVLVQPGFDFKNYPHDEQDLIVRYTVMNYDAAQLQLFPGGVFCSYLPNGDCSFSKNPIWKWANEPSEYSCTTYYDQKHSGQLIWPSYAYYSIHIARQGMGVVVRFVLPLTLLLLISALTFWITYENRVDTTITLLLAVSALYIIILQSIPLVGYLTAVDDFVFWMFFVLCVVVALHQAYATLYAKLDIWPLRAVYLRLVELIGRACLLPVIFSYFLTTMDFGDKALRNGIYVLIALLTAAIFVRECFGVRSAYFHALSRLVDKINDPEVTLQQVSVVEVVVLNAYFFRVLSMSLVRISEVLARDDGGLFFEKPTHIRLKNFASWQKMMHSNGRSAQTSPQEPSAAKAAGKARDFDADDEFDHDNRRKDLYFRRNHSTGSAGTQKKPDSATEMTNLALNQSFNASSVSSAAAASNPASSAKNKKGHRADGPHHATTVTNPLNSTITHRSASNDHTNTHSNSQSNAVGVGSVRGCSARTDPHAPPDRRTISSAVAVDSDDEADEIS